MSSKLLTLLGWSVENSIPKEKKALIIGAPHTSNWDFPLALLALSALGLRFSWIGKHTLFTGPFGRFFSSIGGIPVNRGVRKGFIDQMVNAFQSREQLTLAIAPEGTRSYTDHWKAGFYQIAVRAGINIRLGYIDYPTKTIGLGPILTPSKDIVRDFERIKSFYDNKTGRHPDQKSTICLRDKEIALFNKTYNNTPSDTSS